MPSNSDTYAWFEYGTNTTPPVTVPGFNTQPVLVSATLTGLTPGLAYHYQLACSNAVGFSYGGYLTFTNTDAPSPVLTTLAASSLTTNSAVLNATVNGEGSQAMAYFLYGTDTNYTGGQVGSYTTSETNDTEPFSFTLTNLAPNTTYHYEAVGFNCCSGGFGGDQQFTTAGQ
jgi:hypothetical protein